MRKLRKTFVDQHIFRMTDDTGMFQHTSYNVPDLSKGYTTDDNARALVMAVMLYEKKQQKKYLVLIYRYLAFILHAQNENGVFRNFMNYGRKFTEESGSEECFGRCLWALGYTLHSSAIDAGIKQACQSSMQKALPNIETIANLRGKAYILLGLSYADNSEYHGMITKVAGSIADSFINCTNNEDWYWFEESLTYDNALLPWAMFMAYDIIHEERFLAIAKSSLSFYAQDAFRDVFFRPVGCLGWWIKGEETAIFDQQPLEASMSTLAHLAAYNTTGEKEMLKKAKKSFAWYKGENSCSKSMINKETGGCYDGIMAEGINQNQGAESIVTYLIAASALDKMKMEKRKTSIE